MRRWGSGVWLVMAAALVASCGYGASFVDCTVTCTPASGCPDGFTCGVDGLCRTNGAATACNGMQVVDGGGHADSGVIGEDGGDGGGGTGCPGDLDCDGVLDGVDNCPTVANPDQHDEDHDGLGDKCDPCPPYVNNTDTDGDGVGDLCDPHPSATGDALWLFEGFQHGIPSGWTATGSWTPANGDDVVAITASSGDSTVSLAFAGSADPHWTVFSGFTVTSLTEGSGKFTFAGVAAGATQCGIYDDQALRDVTIINNLTLVNMTAYQLSQGQGYVDQLDQLGGTSFTCTASHADHTTSASTGLSTGTANGASQASVLVATGSTSATVQFHWVMLVTSP